MIVSFFFLISVPITLKKKKRLLPLGSLIEYVSSPRKIPKNAPKILNPKKNTLNALNTNNAKITPNEPYKHFY